MLRQKPIPKSDREAVLRENPLSDGSTVWSVVIWENGKEIELPCINETFARLLLDAIQLYTI